MSVRAALVLGIFLLGAALVHGGLYQAGHDFVMNRFTGWYEFVPSDEGDDDWSTDVRVVRGLHGRARTLTSWDPAGRVGVPHRRR